MNTSDYSLKIECISNSLLDFAANAFIENGYDAVAFDTIISITDSSKCNVYKHIDNKEDLFIQAITHRCKLLASEIIEFDFFKYELKEALYQYSKHVLEITLRKETLSIQRLMITEGAKFPSLSQIIYENGHNIVIVQLSKWIAIQQSNSFFNSDYPAITLANIFINSLISENQNYGLIGADDFPLDKEDMEFTIEIAINVFFNGCKV